MHALSRVEIGRLSKVENPRIQTGRGHGAERRVSSSTFAYCIVPYRAGSRLASPRLECDVGLRCSV